MTDAPGGPWALGRLRALETAFGNFSDPRLAAIPPGDPSERLRLALLAAVLGQELTVAAIRRLLAELVSQLGRGVALGLQACPVRELQRFCAGRTWLATWAHFDSLDGWIRSGWDFLAHHGPPEDWEGRWESPRDLVATLSSQLPWMGATSPHRIKAWRLVRWVVRGELGNRPWLDPSGLRVPVAAVERSLQALGWRPAGWDGWTRPRRQAWLDELLFQVDPRDPARAWVPLDAILARGRSGPACQEFLRGCGACPVRADCPSPGRDV